MLDLVVNFFGTREDDGQISVTDEEREHLLAIHPATMKEVANDDGPILWLLIFPTTTALMNDFIAGKITEKELLLQTPLNVPYDTIYLCSVYVLPEYRNQGLSKKTMTEAINEIRADHPIQSLFYWPFSSEGKNLAVTIAKELNLPLYERT